MDNNTGGPAFPFGQISEVTGQPVNGFYDPGMTLRDYFAAKAMQAVLTKRLPEEECLTAALYSYAMADAMITARAAAQSQEKAE